MSEYNQTNIQIAKIVHDHWPYYKETRDHVSIIWILQCNSKATPVEFWTERWGIRQRVRRRLRCEGEWSFSQLLKPRSMFLTLILLQVGSGSKVRSNGSFRRGESPDQSRADRWVVFADIFVDQSRRTGRGSPSLKCVVSIWTLPEKRWGCKGLPGWLEVELLTP